jgi:hypothetical protein
VILHEPHAPDPAGRGTDAMALAGMTTILERSAGALRVRPWPPDCLPPPGAMVAADGSLRAALGLRARVRRVLAAAGVPFVDALTPPPLPAEFVPPGVVPPPPALAAWSGHGGHGFVVGLGDGEQLDLVLSAVRRAAARTLLVVRDSGAELRWQARLRERAAAAAIDVAPVATVARQLAGGAPRHDLLVVAQPELHPPPTLATAIAGLAPAHVLALVDHAGPELLGISAWAGPLLQCVHRRAAAAHVELHLPLRPDERAAHDAAWHEFLGVYDAFAALRPAAGFGSFVRQARGEPAWRPGLLAWHRARAVAAWNEAKATACGELLARHRGSRVLVFTPDRASAYTIAREHLVAPLTAELPRAERAALLAAFTRGALRTLVGPRLLELGVDAGTADVGILVGGGFGLADRLARHDRIAPAGIVYELVAEQTADVARARRLADALRR